MAKEAIVIVDGAPVGHGRLPYAQGERLGGKAFPEVDGPWGWQVTPEPEGLQDLRTHFIAGAANAYTTVHYNFRWVGP